MSILESYHKLEHTLCLNNNEGHLKYGLDTDENIDCKDAFEMNECLEDVLQELSESYVLKGILKIVTAKKINLAQFIDWVESKKKLVTYEMYVKDYNQKGWFLHLDDNDFKDEHYKLTDEEFIKLVNYCDYYTKM